MDATIFLCTPGTAYVYMYKNRFIMMVLSEWGLVFAAIGNVCLCLCVSGFLQAGNSARKARATVL